jgi:hypothetical protein
MSTQSYLSVLLLTFSAVAAVGCSAYTTDEPVEVEGSIDPTAKAGSGSPHFIAKPTGVSLSGSDLISTFKEAGLSAGSTVTIVTSGDAAITYECVNGGGNNPSASNKTTTSTQFGTSGEFTAEKNGSLTGSQTTSAPSAASLGFACPGGQQVVLVSVSYSNVFINDTTTGSVAGPFAASYTNPAAP